MTFPPHLLYLARPEQKVYEIAKGFLNNPAVDGIKWSPGVMSWCNGTVYKSNHAELEKTCRTQYRRSGPKQIFRADRMLLYHTHHAFLTTNWTRPRVSLVRKDAGFLGHMRRGVKGVKDKYNEGEVILTEWGEESRIATLVHYWNNVKRGQGGKTS